MPPEILLGTAAPTAFRSLHPSGTLPGILYRSSASPLDTRQIPTSGRLYPHPVTTGIPSAHPLSSVRDPKAALRVTILSCLSLAVEPDAKDMAGNPILKPCKAAVKDALSLLDLLAPSVPLPQVSWADDGEIGFCWRIAASFIDVGFYGDGQISYFARVPSAGIDNDGDEDFRPPSLPRPLASAIAALT